MLVGSAREQATVARRLDRMRSVIWSKPLFFPAYLVPRPTSPPTSVPTLPYQSTTITTAAVLSMPIAPITGKLRKRFWLDLSSGLGLGVSAAYAFWYVAIFFTVE